jgi:hypothetical protein
LPRPGAKGPNLAPEYRGVLADRYPPPGVWRQVDEASRSVEGLWAQGRQLDFRSDESGRLVVLLVERGEPVRKLSLLETLAVAAGAPV